MHLHRILAPLLVLILAVAGCSAGQDDDASTASDSTDEYTGEFSGEDSGEMAAGGDGDDVAADGASTGGGRVADVAQVDLEAVPIAAVDRKIIYTGTVSSVVEDVAAAVREVRDAATVEGGYVFAQDLGPGQGRVVLKVPVDRFDAVFDAVVAVGEVEAQHIEAEDVSERFVDLESRQATLATSIDRIRGFLAQTTNVDEISRLESELTNREAEHDVIAGQLRVLRDRTSYGTITADLRLQDPDAALLAEGEGSEGGPPGFGEGLSAGWDAVTTAASAAATVLGFALPFAPVLLLAGALTWWWRRRPATAPPAEA
ncbi:DUF4349 domain-containing protein [Acidimicrobiia bacterium EGI L10123]|uniref:DUF4349 domain-containing protein n=1 Tax=Salinilacustrithrix flava TaxID=2957203 RepID=UPI003D7C2080|nr:DUF4349 domain-containing protein [Acidimicrobiia bacterium EGI L10123]